MDGNSEHDGSQDMVPGEDIWIAEEQLMLSEKLRVRISVQMNDVAKLVDSEYVGDIEACLERVMGLLKANREHWKHRSK